MKNVTEFFKLKWLSISIIPLNNKHYHDYNVGLDVEIILDQWTTWNFEFMLKKKNFYNPVSLGAGILVVFMYFLESCDQKWVETHSNLK